MNAPWSDKLGKRWHKLGRYRAKGAFMGSRTQAGFRLSFPHTSIPLYDAQIVVGPNASATVCADSRGWNVF